MLPDLLASLALVLLPAVSAAQEADQSAAPEAARRALAEARAMQPAYAGEHRYALDPGQRDDVLESLQLFRVAAEAQLTVDERCTAWLQLGTAHVLLAEDDATRLRPEASLEHRTAALAAFHAALDLDPESAHGHYARGVALLELQRPTHALSSLERSLELCSNAIEAELDADLAFATLRYHAGPFAIRAETELDRIDAALERCSAYAAEFSRSPWTAWDALFRRGDVLLSAGRWTQATEELTAALALPEHGETYAAYPQIHERLGHLAALTGDAHAADRHFADALARLADFSDPGTQATLVYAWIFRYAFGPEGAPRERASGKLQQLAARGPVPGPLETAILTLLSTEGPGAQDDFATAVLTERDRRLAAGEPQAALASEAAFFAGLAGERSGSPTAAAKHYERALAQAPREFSWEVAFARTRLTALREKR